MEKEKKPVKRTFEKRLIYAVFGFVAGVFIIVLLGFAFRIMNVEKNNPVLISKDFDYVTYNGSLFYSVDEAPEHLSVIEMRWLDGARLDGASKLDQAFRHRYIYALYKDTDGHRYIWVKDGDYYQNDYEWAYWEKDYPYFDRFNDSYFYKER